MRAGLRSFLRLSAPDRRLVLAVTLLLTAIRLGLRLLPVRAVRRLAGQTLPSHADVVGSDPAYVDRVGWAVRAVAAHLGVTCLPQALTAERLLARRGYPVTLRIGLARPADGHWQGHAWVEHDGRVVVGGAELAQYTRIPAVEGCPS